MASSRRRDRNRRSAKSWWRWRSEGRSRLFLTADAGKRLALIGTLVFILIVELLTPRSKNSATASPSTATAAKRIKDMGSAAILLSLVLAGAVWIWIAAERFWPAAG